MIPQTTDNGYTTELYLLTAHTDGYTGCDTFCEELLKGLVRLGRFRLQVLILDSPDTAIRRETHGDITFLYLPWSRQHKFAATEHCLLQAVTPAPNAVFVSNFFPALFHTKAIRKLFPFARICQVVHDLPWLTVFSGDETAYMNYLTDEHTERFAPEKDKFVRYCTYDLLETFRMADRIVCLCPTTFRLLTDFYGIPSRKIRLICNGMEDYATPLSVYDRACLRQKYGFPLHAPILSMVGRLTLSKGADRIEAMLDGLEAASAYRLVYVGNDDISQWLSREKLSRTTSVGFRTRKEMQEIYSVVDGALFPSRHEQCSYVGIELLMHGLPVLATPAYGVRDMFTKENAVLLTPGSMPVTRTELEAHREAARNSYLTRYTLDGMIKRYSALLRESA